MNNSLRRLFGTRWWLLVGVSGILPAFTLRCQEASLDLQRSLLQSIAFRITDVLFQSFSAQL